MKVAQYVAPARLTVAEATEALAKRVPQIADESNPSAHTPMSKEFFDDALAGAVVDLCPIPGGGSFNPAFVKGFNHPGYSSDFATKHQTDPLFNTARALINLCPVIPDGPVGTTMSLVVGVGDIYEHWDELSSKELTVIMFDQFVFVANQIASRTIPGYSVWPQALVNFGILCGEHLYLVHGEKHKDFLGLEKPQDFLSLEKPSFLSRLKGFFGRLIP